MRHAQQRFPIDVRTGWVDYSPALRYHASQRIRARLAEFASQIRSVTVLISDDEPHKTGQRCCEIEVMTTHSGTNLRFLGWRGAVHARRPYSG